MKNKKEKSNVYKKIIAIGYQALKKNNFSLALKAFCEIAKIQKQTKLNIENLSKINPIDIPEELLLKWIEELKNKTQT